MASYTYTYNKQWLFNDRTKSNFGQPSGIEKTSAYDLKTAKIFPRVIPTSGYTSGAYYGYWADEIVFDDFDISGTYVSCGVNTSNIPIGQLLTRVFKLSEAKSSSSTKALRPNSYFMLFADAELPAPGYDGLVKQTLPIGLFKVKESGITSLEGRHVSIIAEDWTGDRKGIRRYDTVGYWDGTDMTTLMGKLAYFRSQGEIVGFCAAINKVVRNKTDFEILEAAAGFFGCNFIADDVVTATNTKVTMKPWLTVCPSSAALDPTAAPLTFTESSYNDLISWDSGNHGTLANSFRRIFEEYYSPFIPEDVTAEAPQKLTINYTKYGDNAPSSYVITLSPSSGSGITIEINNPFAIADLEAQTPCNTAEAILNVLSKYHKTSRGKRLTVDIPGDPLIMPCAWYGFKQTLPAIVNNVLTTQVVGCVGMVSGLEFHFCGKTKIDCQANT